MNFSNTHHSYLSVLKVADRQDLPGNTHHSYLGVLKVADRQDLPGNTHHSYLGILKVADRQDLPTIKIEALAPGIMHIVYCFFSNMSIKKLQIFGLDSNNLNEYIQRNQEFFQKY